MDEKYMITTEEREKILNTYFKQGLEGPLDTFPSKEKRKMIVLQHIIKRFDPSKRYSEKEVSDILRVSFHDFATLRRYFIDFGFMDRNKDGTEYWVIC